MLPPVAKRHMNSVPLFMSEHIAVANAQIAPIEGIDFLYDDTTQKSEWLTTMVRISGRKPAMVTLKLMV